MDWDDLRFCLAIIRYGRLSRAARYLRVTQTTVGRRLAALERSTGVRLVRRSDEGFLLTPAGKAIRAHIERIETEVLAIERLIRGHDTRLDSPVRVHGSEVLVAHVLPACVARLRAYRPDITLELLPDDPEADLLRHEADVSIRLGRIRLGRIDRHDLIVRRIGHLAFGLYAATAYLGGVGAPDFAAGCPGQTLIDLLDENELAAQAAWLAAAAPNARMVLRTDNHEAQFRAAAQGGGMAVLPRFRADAEPALRRLATPTSIPSAEIWLAVHQDNRRAPRIRTVCDSIATVVAQHIGQPQVQAVRPAPLIAS
jgi:DNA-binding transcriptional LysR family regulator